MLQRLGARAWLFGAIMIIYFPPLFTVFIERKVADYFQDETTKRLKDEWKNHNAEIEEALKIGLQRNFIMEKTTPKVTDSLYVIDNAVKILFKSLKIRESPQIYNVDVFLNLARNFLHAEFLLSRIVLEGSYLLFRNSSYVMPAKVRRSRWNWKKNFPKHFKDVSPFTYQEVKPEGYITIVADRCLLIGRALPILTGATVTFNHKTFDIDQCEFSIEIGYPGSKDPPIMASYFPPAGESTLELLLLRAILDVVVYDLQSAAVTYLNTSVLFGNNYLTYRHHQEKILRASSDFFMRLTRTFNKIAVEDNLVDVDLEDLEITWDEGGGGDKTFKLLLHSITLHGLDTLYSADRGGPYHINADMKIMEQLRFGSLKVTGNLYFETADTQSSSTFSVDIVDAAMDVQIDIDPVYNNSNENTKPLLEKYVDQFVFVGWRSMDYSISNVDEQEIKTRDQSLANDVIGGYMWSAVPKVLLHYLVSTNKKALKKTDDEKNIENGGKDQSGDEDNEIAEGDKMVK